jgi:hypothetical protein
MLQDVADEEQILMRAFEFFDRVRRLDISSSPVAH